ncbi:MAG: hypothetical protein M0005_15080 [Actinomycetota bacterium]|nr:hypothetical protein [Actinomycetota bacterium]
MAIISALWHYALAMSGSVRKRGANSWQVRVSLGERDPRTGRSPATA